MTDWKIVYSANAAKDLRNIYEYIAFTLLEPGIAKSLTKRIMNAIIMLDHMPLRHRLYEKEPWRSKGLRILPVDNYLVFYLPVESEKSVGVVRIMYGGRNIEEQLHAPDMDT